MIKTLKWRLNVVIAIVLIGVLAVIAIYTFHILLWHKLISEQEKCTYETLFSTDLFGELYDAYAVTRIVLAFFIDLWIAISTIITLRML